MIRNFACVWLLATVVTLVACDQGANATPEEECKAAGAVLAKLMTPAEEAFAHAALPAAIAKRCTDDRWTPAARKCLRTVSSNEALSDCSYSHLTQEQSDKLDKTWPSSPYAKESLAKMSELTDKMCACNDPVCAQNVSDEMTRWSEQVARKYTGAPHRMSAQDSERAADLGERLADCMLKAMGAGH